jgi:hypothetical protein
MTSTHYIKGYRDGLRDADYTEPFPDTAWRPENRQYGYGFADAKDSLMPDLYLEGKLND